jgi:hypothetical protein
MPSTYTSNNKIQKIATGEQSGTWGSTTNTNFDLFDTAIDGFVAVAITGTTHTLNIPDGSAADGRNKVLSFTGALSAANTVSVTPNTVKKHYFVQNNTTGSQNVIISQGSGSTVTIKPGYSSVVYLDGAGGSASAKEVLTSLKLTALLEATGVVFVGSTSGSTTLQATATASGTLTMPAATDTLVGKATTDTFTNKTLDTAGTGNVLRINGTQVSAVTGTGSVVLATSPTLVTPAIGTPTSGTLTSCTGLPISTGVSGLGSGVATFLATPSSANLASAVTDETGSGALVFATSPTIATPTVTTSAVIPLVNGGTAVSSTLTLQSTSGVGTSDAIIFKTAAQSEKMRILTDGNVGIGTATPGTKLSFGNSTASVDLSGTKISVYDGAGEFYGIGLSKLSTNYGLGLYSASLIASGVPKVFIENTGNVGIGTTSPATALEVFGSITARAATTQDSVIVAGRAGGTSGFGVTLTPTTLTASRTVTLADGNTTLATGTMAATSGTLAQFAATTSAQLAGVISDETGTGALVFATSPTLVTPLLGTPTSGTLTNCTGLPIATGVSGLGTSVATFLATPSSANLAAALTDETGTGANVFATSPTVSSLTVNTSLSVVGGRSSFAAASEAFGVGAKYISTGGSVFFGATSASATPDAQISAGTGSPLMTLLNSGGVGIGTTNPAFESTNCRLALVGGATFASNVVTSNTNAVASFRGWSSTGYSLAIGSVATTGIPYIQGVNYNGGSVAADLALQGFGGNVGIGTTAPRTTLSVLQSGTANTTADTLGPAVFTGPTAGGYSGMLVVEANDAMAANVGGSIGFYGRNTTASTAGAYFSSIHGRKENGTSGDQAGYIAFKVRTTGNADNEVVRIASTGNVGIGTTTPAYKLEISTDSAGKPGVGGLWTVVSDERIKTDISPANLDRCYEIVKSVPLKHFGFAPGVYTDDQIQDKHNLGWIAQDVQKVFSKAVSVKPFTLKTEIPDGTEEYEEQDSTLETVETTEKSMEIIDGKPVQVSKVVTSENKVLLFDTVDVVDEAGAVVMDGDKPLTYQMPRMITKTRNKVRHDVIEDCLDLNGGQMIAALYGAVQALMLKVESLTASK